MSPFFQAPGGLLYGGAPVWVVAVAEAGRWRGLVGDAGHGLDGTAEEAAVGRSLAEGPGAPRLRHASEGETGCRFGRQAAAQRLDLLGDEGGGGDVSVAEVADLLQRLSGGRQRVHVQGRQVDGGGRELLVGALVLRAQAVDPPVEVLQVNLLVVLFWGGGGGEGGREEGKGLERWSREGCWGWESEEEIRKEREREEEEG